MGYTKPSLNLTVLKNIHSAIFIKKLGNSLGYIVNHYYNSILKLLILLAAVCTRFVVLFQMNDGIGRPQECSLFAPFVPLLPLVWYCQKSRCQSFCNG